MTIYLHELNADENPHAEGLRLLSKVYEKNYTLIYNDKSKPYIKDDDSFFFNISHSGAWVCLAASNTEIGVDIEIHNPTRTRLAKRFFTQDEQAVCHSVTDFFNIWTQKEAFIKAVGVGLSYGINTFSVFDKQDGYVIKNLKAPIGYSLSVCERAEVLSDIQIIYL